MFVKLFRYISVRFEWVVCKDTESIPCAQLKDVDKLCCPSRAMWLGHRVFARSSLGPDRIERLVWGVVRPLRQQSRRQLVSLNSCQSFEQLNRLDLFDNSLGNFIFRSLLLLIRIEAFLLLDLYYVWFCLTEVHKHCLLDGIYQISCKFLQYFQLYRK